MSMRMEDSQQGVLGLLLDPELFALKNRLAFSHKV